MDREVSGRARHIPFREAAEDENIVHGADRRWEPTITSVKPVRVTNRVGGESRSVADRTSAATSCSRLRDQRVQHPTGLRIAEQSCYAGQPSRDGLGLPGDGRPLPRPNPKLLDRPAVHGDIPAGSGDVLTSSYKHRVLAELRYSIERIRSCDVFVGIIVRRQAWETMRGIPGSIFYRAPTWDTGVEAGAAGA